jgi:MFS family permease
MSRSPFLAITGFFVLSGTTFGVWASRIPAVAEFHELSKQQLGLLLLLLALGALLSFSSSGWACDRYGTKRVCQITGALIALSMIGAGISENLWAFCVAIFLFGAGHGSCDIAMNVWATDWEKKSGKSLMGFFHAMWSVGGGCGAATGVLAAYGSVGYGLHFTVVAVIVSSIVLFLSTNRWYVTDPAPSKAKAFSIPRGPLLLVGTLLFCASVVEGSITDWSAILLVTLSNATQAQAALGYTAFSIAMVATRLFGHVLMARFDIVVLSRFCGALAAIGMTASALSTNLIVSIVGFVLAGFGVALFFPLVFRRAGNDPVIPKGEAMASVATLGYGGMLFGPPIIGWIAEYTSLSVSFIGVAFLCLTIVALARHLAAPKAGT